MFASRPNLVVAVAIFTAVLSTGACSLQTTPTRVVQDTPQVPIPPPPTPTPCGSSCVKTFIASLSGYNGVYSGAVSQPLTGSVKDSNSNVVLSGTNTVTPGSTSVAVHASIQVTGVGTLTTDATIPNPMPIGQKVALNSRVTAQQNSNGVVTAWFAKNGVNYTATITPNSDGTSALSVVGSNGSTFNSQIPKFTQQGASAAMRPMLTSCQQNAQGVAAATWVAVIFGVLAPPAAPAMAIGIASMMLAYTMQCPG